LESDADVLIIRMERVPHIDQSGLYAMEDALLDLKQRGVTVLLTGVNPQPMDMLRRIDIVPALVSEAQVFESLDASIDWVNTQREAALAPQT
jgi:SulP family sulfate permease